MVARSAGPTPIVPPVCVRVYTLDGFRVEATPAGGELSTRTNSRPLLLLKLLVALGGEAVAIETLCEHLWSDADGDHAHDAFHTTLGRLRRLIGRDAVRIEGGRLSLSAERCWVDVHACVTALGRAHDAVRHDDVPAASQHMEDGLRLYRRPFLDGETDLAPFVATRTRLAALLRRRVRDVGEFLAAAGHPDRAIALYERGLEADDLAEDIHQHLIRAYLDLGRVAEGREAYHRCLEALRRGLVEPSPDTTILARTLQERTARARTSLEGATESSAAGSHGVDDGERVRLAVLPFRTADEDEEARRYADGLAEDLLTDLGQMSLLTVLGREVAIAFGADLRALTRLGQASDVPYVLTGSVRHVGERLRGNVRLLETRSGRQVWGLRFDRDIREAFQAQDDIVASIVEETEVRVLEGEQARSWRRTGANPEATALFLRGWHSWRSRMDHEGAASCGRLMAQAIALDPSFPCAHTCLGKYHLSLAEFGWTSDRAAALEQGLAHLQHSLALRPDLAEGHAGLSTYHMLAGDYDEGLRAAETSVACEPGAGDVRISLARCQMYAGLPDRAVDTARRAQALVPRPRPTYRMWLGAAHLVAGRPAEALACLTSAVRDAPALPLARVWLTAAHAALGQREQARAAARELRRLAPDFDVGWWVRRGRVFRRDTDTRRLIEWLRTAGLVEPATTFSGPSLRSEPARAPRSATATASEA